MEIYQYVFGVDSGQVHCVFHDDTNRSAGIGPNGEYNCFTCGAKAHNSVGFIAKYFNVSINQAKIMHGKFHRLLTGYPYTMNPITDEQRNYLVTNGMDPSYFFNSASNKLFYRHTWNGLTAGYTEFNPPELSNYHAGASKYVYNKNITAGMLTPYDDVVRYKTLVITEGEKDMLTAKAQGMKHAVAKVGGAITRIIAGKNLQDKKVVLIYDCDDAGRAGAKKDAIYLTDQFNCKVRVVDLGLKDKEDLNDYFVKYKHTVADLNKLIVNTPIYVVQPEDKLSKIEKLYSSLTASEKKELADIIKQGDLQ